MSRKDLRRHPLIFNQMNKDRERLGVNDLLANLMGWSLVSRIREESPDFVIENDITGQRVGVEVADYYPNRSRKGNALVRIPGKDAEETRKNKLRYFTETALGHSRFVPKLDIEDFYSSLIADKEEKLKLYKINEPECQEFWLLVMLDFYDNILYENASVIVSSFDRIFVWEEPHTIFELATCLNLSNKK